MFKKNPAILFYTLIILIISSCVNTTDKEAKTEETKILTTGDVSLKSDIKQESENGIKTQLDVKAMVIFRDKKDNLWFASEEKGVYKYDGENLVLFTSEDGLTTYRVIGVQEDKMGNLYFDTPDDVFKFDGEKFTALPIVDSTESASAWNSGSDDLWFRIGWDNKGPYRFDGKNLYRLKFPKSMIEDEFYKKHPSASINPYAIYSVYRDSKANMWFGTSNMGIYLFDGNEISWMNEDHLMETPEGGNFGVRSITEDKDGNYWISNANYKYSLLPNTQEGEGLKNLNYKRHVGIEDMNKENLYFYSMLSNSNGVLLMFAQDYGLWLNNGKELTQFFIIDGEKQISPTSIYKDNYDTFWFGTAENGIYEYDGKVFKKLKIE